MFGIGDIPKFILAFFVLPPVISTIHEVGHVFFAWLMGGTKANELAKSNRPGKVISSKDGEEKEISNYPRIPL